MFKGIHYIDFLGLIGSGLILFSFYRNSIGRWTGKSLWYELDNLAGAILMSLYALSKGAYISIFMNGVWAIVAFRGISSIAERKVRRRLKKRR
jgi:hypothetical protein